MRRSVVDLLAAHQLDESTPPGCDQTPGRLPRSRVSQEHDPGLVARQREILSATTHCSASAAARLASAIPSLTSAPTITG